MIGSYFKIDSPIGVQPVAIALGSQRCLNTPPTTPSSPLREAPQSPSDGHISSLSSHSGSGCSDILLGKSCSAPVPTVAIYSFAAQTDHDLGRGKKNACECQHFIEVADIRRPFLYFFFAVSHSALLWFRFTLHATSSE